MARLLDGKALAVHLQEGLSKQVADFAADKGVTPTLAAALIGENPASEVYVRNKRAACERVGIASQLHRLPADASQEQLLALVDKLNRDRGVHGILVQLPLPPTIDAAHVLDGVHPSKDVDCFHPQNVGLLSQGRPIFLPCTPHGVQQLLHHSGIPVAGKRVVVVGRSDIVGKPLAMLLMQKDSTCGPSAANATVTICHSQSQDLAEITRQADVLVAAIGKAQFITADMIRPGAVVIDVGMNRIASGLCGDVDFANVRGVASAITPVPGGVGPLTVAMLLFNTLKAAQMLSLA